MSEARPVIVCTSHRGVFFGYATETTGQQVTLERARCAIVFGTTKGIFELAETGPTLRSKIGAVAPRVELRDVTAVIDVTPAAETKWLEA